MATISLGEFERLYGVNRGTVHKTAKDKGFKTCDGLDPVAVDVLQKHFGVGPYAPVQRPQQPEETSVELVVVEGSTQGIETPQMERYTFKMPEVLANTFDDPLALASQFLEFGDQLIEQLDEKTAALKKRAEDTHTASQLIARQTRKLAAKQRTAEIHEVVSTVLLERDTVDIKRQTGVA